MSYLLPHLHSGWEVDQAIVTEEDRVVVIQFGRDEDPTCMIQDEVLMSIAEKVKNFAKIYVVDIDEVPDFNNMYELYDPCTTMFFYRNKVSLNGWATADSLDSTRLDFRNAEILFLFSHHFLFVVVDSNNNPIQVAYYGGSRDR